MESSEYIPVPEFYAGRSVFITGATGFVGKVLVEKLLRSCPNIGNIYLLIRAKKGRDVRSRLLQILGAPLFDLVRQDQPHALDKVIPVSGDVMEESLGLSDADQQMLAEQVSVVFHSAATVKFDEEIKVSARINMFGTKSVIELSHRMPNLVALVHVSTAYCNCNREEVHEMVYQPPYDPEELMYTLNWMDSKLANSITPELLGNRPNTYTLTKSMAEYMMHQNASSLPIAIVRPSVVIACHNEPLVGWVDNWTGANGMFAAVIKGIFRGIRGNGSVAADFIPVDFVSNHMICAAWQLGISKPSGTVVYNCTTSHQNPIQLDTVISEIVESTRKHPIDGLIWYPKAYIIRHNFTKNFVYLTMHYIPAYVMDFISKLKGQKPSMIQIQDRLSKAASTTAFFASREWRFPNAHTVKLQEQLSKRDRETYNFDALSINWSEFLEQYVLGIRKYLYKQDLNTLPRAKKQIQRLYWVRRIFQLSFVLLALRVAFVAVSSSNNSYLESMKESLKSTLNSIMPTRLPFLSSE